MDQATLWLAVLPPALAIAVEFFNPISLEMLRRSADSDLRAFDLKARNDALQDAIRAAPAPLDPALEALRHDQPVDQHEAVVREVSRSARAAVEVGGLAPTLVATATSGLAVLKELPSPFGPAVGYVVVFIALVLLVLKLIGGYTFREIDDYTVFQRPEWLRRTRTEFVSFTIYFANGLLILAALLAFYVAGDWRGHVTTGHGNATQASDHDHWDKLARQILQALHDLAGKPSNVTIGALQFTDEQANRLGLQIVEAIQPKIVLQSPPTGSSKRLERSEPVFFASESDGGAGSRADQELVRGQVARALAHWRGDIQSGRCTILLAGSTDTTGPDQTNNDLSVRRTALVQRLIETILAPTSVPISALPNGERNLPVGTVDETKEWRNRRVDMSLRCTAGPNH